MLAEETVSAIYHLAGTANANRRTRILTEEDIQRFIHTFEMFQDDPATKEIKVYPRNAFVAKSYAYRAETSYLLAYRDMYGAWIFRSGRSDAHRSYGAGAITLRNGRGI